MPISESQLNKALEAQTEDLAKRNQKFLAEFQKEILGLVKDLGGQIKEIVETQRSCNSQIAIINAGMSVATEKVLEHEVKFGEVIKELTSLKKANVSLKKELESLKIQARQKNIMIYGIKEEAGETKPALKRKVCELLISHYGMAEVSIDLPTRIPPNAPPTDKTRSRPVLVSFAIKSDRDSVLFRKVSGCPYAVKAHLPRLTSWAKENNVKYKGADHDVEMKNTSFYHEEAKDFLEALITGRE